MDFIVEFDLEQVLDEPLSVDFGGQPPLRALRARVVWAAPGSHLRRANWFLGGIASVVPVFVLVLALAL